MYDVAYNLLEIVSFLFQGCCLQYFVGSFLESRFSKGKLNHLPIIVLYAILNFVAQVVVSSVGESTWIFGRLVSQLFVILILIFFFYKAFHMITVFLVVTFIATSQICLFVAHIILQVGGHIFELWSWLFSQQYVSDIRAYDLIMKASVLGLFVLYHIAYASIMYFSLKGIIRNFRESNRNIGKAELLFILTPGLISLLICILLREIIVTIDGTVPELIYDKHPLLIFLVPAILLLSLLSIQYGVKLFQDMIERNRERNNIIILEKQVGNMQEHIKEMERIYSGIRSIRHDMKNTLSIITQLAAENGKAESSELNIYLSELNRTIDELEQRFKTGNTVVDTLLNMKCHEAMRLLPDMIIDADNLMFPADLAIQSYDIGVIMGNALDNAIDACKKLKTENAQAKIFIQLSSFCRGNMFFIEIKNTFNGEVIRKKREGFPETSKADKRAHGIGLENIKNTAEKYQGAVEWSVKNRVFTLLIMMQNKKDERSLIQ